AAGALHTCAVKSGGTLFCWGNNDVGQLGDGTQNLQIQPEQIGTDTDWTAVSAGFASSCGLQGGLGSCWGANNDGQLGDGTNATPTTPPAVGISHWESITPRAHHTCGRRSDNRPGC